LPELVITYFKQYHFKKKKPLISFLSVFPPYRGGIATFSDFLFDQLQSRVDIKAYNFTNLYPSLLFPGKSQYLDPKDTETEYANRLLHSWNPLNWKQTASEIAIEKPEHLLISYWHPFFAPAFIRIITHVLKNSPDTKISILAHNVLPHEKFPLGNFLTKILLKKADHVIVLSEKSRSEADTLSISTKVTKLFHPVYEQDHPDKTRSELRKQFGFSDDEFVLLFFGLIRPYKGLDLMIKALNEMDLKAKGIRPFIVGEFYMDKEQVLSKINETHRKFYTIIDRFVSDQEMAEILTLSDAMVMPYRSATQSGILANAINFKLPCIVSDLEGLTEHIEADKSALVFPSENVPELKEAIYSILKIDTRTTIVSHLEKIKEELSWQAFTDRLLGKLIEENP
jgi:glycosyltransferase involved in cell wall biosynthesis